MKSSFLWVCVPVSFQQGANLNLKFPLSYNFPKQSFFTCSLQCLVKVIPMVLFAQETTKGYPLSCALEAVTFLVKFGLNWPTGPQLEGEKDGRHQGW